MANRHRGHGRT